MTEEDKRTEERKRESLKKRKALKERKAKLEKIEARRLKKETLLTYRAIAERLFVSGFSPHVRSESWVYLAAMTLEEKVLHLYISRKFKPSKITEQINREGYHSRRSKNPTVGCVIGILIKHDVY